MQGLHSEIELSLIFALLWQCDTQLKDAVDLIVDCAFGQPPYSDTNQIPAPSTCVDVAVRESAYNPLHPQHQLQNTDETIYVAFQQRIQIKVCLTVPKHAFLSQFRTKICKIGRVCFVLHIPRCPCSAVTNFTVIQILVH